MAAESASAGKTAVETTSKVARQGIFDAQGQLAGYELFFRGYHDDAAKLPDSTLHVPGISEHDRATSAVIVSTFSDFGFEELAGGVPLFINMTRAFISGELPLPFSSRGVVLEVLENIRPAKDVLLGLRELKQRGFQIAIDDYDGSPGRDALVEFADYVKIDLQFNWTRGERSAQRARELAPDTTLVAERIETHADFELCKQAGFSLFQGYLFEKPVLMQRKQLSASEVVCLKLVRVLAAESPDPLEVERLIKGDPALAARIVRTANSAAAGTSHYVTSLRQALVMLGPKQLNTWVLLTLMGGMTRVRPDQVTQVLARALCAESLAVMARLNDEEAFTLGMLTGLSDILGLDDDEMLRHVGLDASVMDLNEGSGLSALITDVRHHASNECLPLHSTAFTGEQLARTYLSSWAEATRLANQV